VSLELSPFIRVANLFASFTPAEINGMSSKLNVLTDWGKGMTTVDFSERQILLATLKVVADPQSLNAMDLTILGSQNLFTKVQEIFCKLKGSGCLNLMKRFKERNMTPAIKSDDLRVALLAAHRGIRQPIGKVMAVGEDLEAAKSKLQILKKPPTFFGLNSEIVEQIEVYQVDILRLISVVSSDSGKEILEEYARRIYPIVKNLESDPSRCSVKSAQCLYKLHASFSSVFNGILDEHKKRFNDAISANPKVKVELDSELEFSVVSQGIWGDYEESDDDLETLESAHLAYADIRAKYGVKIQ
jgi:hypothetical protein